MKIYDRVGGTLQRIKNIYGMDLHEAPFGDDGIRFTIANSSGEGVITVFNVYEGIHVVFNDIHMEFYKSNGQFESNIIEINHCFVGRSEYLCDDRNIAYISEGDLSISDLKFDKNDYSYFPTKHYHGVSIFLSYDKLKENKLLKEFGIDLNKVYRLVSNLKVKIYRSDERLEHIFYEFYHAENNFMKEYLRIKVLELLLFITNLDWEKEEIKKSYLTKKQVIVIKRIKNLLVRDLTVHYTIDELSKRFKISPTSLKTQFKELYGDSLYGYVKKIKLEKSKELLIEGKLSIAEIALEIGYLNPAKFSSAFKKEYGVSPSKFKV